MPGSVGRNVCQVLPGVTFARCCRMQHPRNLAHVTPLNTWHMLRPEKPGHVTFSYCFVLFVLFCCALCCSSFWWFCFWVFELFGCFRWLCLQQHKQITTKEQGKKACHKLRLMKQGKASTAEPIKEQQCKRNTNQSKQINSTQAKAATQSTQS